MKIPQNKHLVIILLENLVSFEHWLIFYIWQCQYVHIIFIRSENNIYYDYHCGLIIIIYLMDSYTIADTESTDIIRAEPQIKTFLL